MEPNFVFKGTIDVSPLEQKLEPLDWNAYTFRQTKFNVHKETLTVRLSCGMRCQPVKKCPISGTPTLKMIWTRLHSS
jgi:hypothetical protein